MSFRSSVVVGSGNKQAGRGGELSASRRVRYLIDIIVLAAATVAVERGFGAVYVPTSPQSGVVFDFLVKLPAVLFAWLLLRLRRETVADVGLKRPGSWSRAFLIGLVIAIIVFSAAYISEKIGLRRDLSQFKAVQGNLELTLYEVAYAFTGAGFYEEFMFRGFLLHGLAMFLGASRGAWVVACILRGLLFGLAHAYQNPLGIAFTGAVGMVLGFLFLACGRNLWPLDHPARAVRRESLCFILKGRRSTEERRGRGKWKKKRLAAAREPFANQ